MGLVGFQYEPVSLDVNEIFFKEKPDIPNSSENSRKSQGGIHKNVTYLSCGEVEALGCFQLLDMRYGDRNMVTERVGITVLQLYLI